MPQRCSICVHGGRREIEKALVTGTSYRQIAERFGTSLSAVCRHGKHTAQAIVKASERREERLGDNLIEEMRRMNRKAWDLLGKAEAEGDYRGAIVALREARECIQAQYDILSRTHAAEDSRISIIMDI